MTNQNEELLPCPFCNASDRGFARAETGRVIVEELALDFVSHGKRWRVRCGGCGLSNTFITREDANRWWNTRTSPWNSDMGAAPRDGSPVDLFLKYKNDPAVTERICDARYVPNYWWETKNGQVIETAIWEITHWQLTQPPEEG